MYEIIVMIIGTVLGIFIFGGLVFGELIGHILEDYRISKCSD